MRTAYTERSLGSTASNISAKRSRTSPIAFRLDKLQENKGRYEWGIEEKEKIFTRSQRHASSFNQNIKISYARINTRMFDTQY